MNIQDIINQGGKYYTPDGSLDKALQKRVFKEFGISIGDFGIRDITTIPDLNFRIISFGGGLTHFIDLETSIQSGGYIRFYGDGTSVLHIAPTLTKADRIDFMSTTAHELVHCIHSCLIPGHSELFGERVAYETSYRICIQAGRTEKAEAIKNTAMTHFCNNEPLWGPYPTNYGLGWCEPLYQLVCDKLNRKHISLKGFLTTI